MSPPPPSPLPLNRSSIEAAHELIKPHIHLTPVLTSTTLSEIASTPQTPEALIGTPWEGQRPARPKIKFFFKCENLQKIGAFKVRGAFHALARLSEEELARGVITHSSGNHAQALAYAAATFRTPAHIIMPTISTPSKIAATKTHGAVIHFSGSTSTERETLVSEIQARTNTTLIPPYDHPDIILGQGTVALETEVQVRELVEQDPSLSVHHFTSITSPPYHLDALIAPLGGGGLLSGLSLALAPTPTKLFGAEPSFSGADDGARGLAAGCRIPNVDSLTIADGLRTPVGHLNWSILSSFFPAENQKKKNPKRGVEGVYAVSEDHILAALKLVLERVKVVVEPSAVVGLAVALFDEGFRGVVEREGGKEGWDLGVVFSGGNVGVEALGGWFGGGFAGGGGGGRGETGER